MQAITGAPRIVIRGTAAYLPEQVISSARVGARVGLSAADVVHRTGIENRRWAAPEQAASDLAIAAGKQVLANTAVAPDTIDLLIVSTTSADMPFPSTACLVQRGLGLGTCGAFDVMASCSGFLAALSMARSALLCGTARRALVICADVKSRFLDLDDASTAIIFGDGAGAALIERHDTPGTAAVGPVRLHTDGSRWAWVHMPAGGSRQPLSEGTLEARLHTLKMDGIPLFRMAVRRFCEVVGSALDEAGLGQDDIACYVFHQANLRILEAVATRLKLPRKRVATTLEQYGNTSSASLPITLHSAVADGRIQPGDRVLLATFGGGITWGACVVTWGDSPEAPGTGAGTP